VRRVRGIQSKTFRKDASRRRCCGALLEHRRVRFHKMSIAVMGWPGSQGQRGGFALQSHVSGAALARSVAYSAFAAAMSARTWDWRGAARRGRAMKPPRSRRWPMMIADDAAFAEGFAAREEFVARSGAISLRMRQTDAE